VPVPSDRLPVNSVGTGGGSKCTESRAVGARRAPSIAKTWRKCSQGRAKPDSYCATRALPQKADRAVPAATFPLHSCIRHRESSLLRVRERLFVADMLALRTIIVRNPGVLSGSRRGQKKIGAGPAASRDGHLGVTFCHRDGTSPSRGSESIPCCERDDLP